MSIRTQWTDFDKETRKYIKKRDNNQCVICHSKGALQIMHIFLSRGQGGKGCKENGCLGCIKCHKILDNPIGEQENRIYLYWLDFLGTPIKEQVFTKPCLSFFHCLCSIFELHDFYPLFILYSILNFSSHQNALFLNRGACV